MKKRYLAYYGVKEETIRVNNKETLTHAGVKGMKWGLRRYQNQDGTLTPEGRARYGATSYHKLSPYKKAQFNRETEERSRKLKRNTAIAAAVVGTVAAVGAGYFLHRFLEKRKRSKAALAAAATKKMNEAIKNGVTEKLKEQTKEAVSDAVKNNIKDTAENTVKGAANDAVKNSTKDAAKGGFIDAVKNVSNKLFGEKAKDTISDTVKNMTTDEAKKKAKDKVKDEAVKAVANSSEKVLTTVPASTITEGIIAVTKQSIIPMGRQKRGKRGKRGKKKK